MTLSIQSGPGAALRRAIVSCIESYSPALRSETVRAALADGYARVRERAQELTRQSLVPHDAPAPEILSSITSVILASVDGLMIQWIADPSVTPNSVEVVDRHAALGVIAAG